MSIFEIKIFKENIHFNAAHFTILSDQKRERLHGHDYFLKANFICQTSLENGLIFNYADLKSLLIKLTQELNEYFLIPKYSPYLKFNESKNNIEFLYHDDFFSIPKKDIKLLPIENISNECLLNWLYTELIAIWKPIPKDVLSIELELENGRGQSISKSWSLK